MKVRDDLNYGRCGLKDITRAASLAHLGLLGSPDCLEIDCDLQGRDAAQVLSIIPSEKLAALVSSVTWCVYIRNASAGLSCLVLQSLKCDEVFIDDQSLGTEETQALVRAMETCVKEVILRGRHVTLDTEALLQYSGQGRCSLLQWYAYGHTEKELRSRTMNKIKEGIEGMKVKVTFDIESEKISLKW